MYMYQNIDIHVCMYNIYVHVCMYVCVQHVMWRFMFFWNHGIFDFASSTHFWCTQYSLSHFSTANLSAPAGLIGVFLIPPDVIHASLFTLRPNFEGWMIYTSLTTVPIYSVNIFEKHYILRTFLRPQRCVRDHSNELSREVMSKLI